MQTPTVCYTPKIMRRGRTLRHLSSSAVDRSSESGQSMTEYIIVLVAIAVVVLVLFVGFGGKISNLFMGASNTVDQLDGEQRQITATRANNSSQSDNSRNAIDTSDSQTRVRVGDDGSTDGGQFRGKRAGAQGPDGGSAEAEGGFKIPWRDIMLLLMLVFLIMGGAKAAKGGGSAN